MCVRAEEESRVTEQKDVFFCKTFSLFPFFVFVTVHYVFVSAGVVPLEAGRQMVF